MRQASAAPHPPDGATKVLITGAGSGIGARLAMLLSDVGHAIVVTDLDASAASAVATHITDAGGVATSARLDVTNLTEVAEVVSAAGAIGVLVNNAGLQVVSSLEEFPADAWQQIIDVMLVGAASVSRAVLPGMRRRNFGRIVNIGSIHSLVASPYKSAYVAAKHGLLGLSKAIALETGDTNITINTICPAYVRTPLVEAQIAAQARKHALTPDQVVRTIMLKPMPKQVFVTPEEIAALTLFLISDSARNVTAQAIAIDGGWTAQ